MCLVGRKSDVSLLSNFDVRKRSAANTKPPQHTLIHAKDTTRMNFRIKGLASAQFEHLFGLSDDNLKAFNAKRYIAGSKPGFPCRLTLEDADPGETLLLAPYRHQTSRTAYASEGPIFIREHHARPAEYINEIPEQIRSRLISLRAYDGDGMMIDADVVDGTLVQPLIKRFLTDERTSYLHAHFARRGCYAALIERA